MSTSSLSTFFFSQFKPSHVSVSPQLTFCYVLLTQQENWKRKVYVSRYFQIINSNENGSILDVMSFNISSRESCTIFFFLLFAQTHKLLASVSSWVESYPIPFSIPILCMIICIWLCIIIKGKWNRNRALVVKRKRIKRSFCEYWIYAFSVHPVPVCVQWRRKSDNDLNEFKAWHKVHAY